MSRGLTTRCTGHRLACSEPSVSFGLVVSFNNVVLVWTVGGAGELKVR